MPREIETVDVICPTYYVPWSYINSNVESWFKELPLRKLWFGSNNPAEDEFKSIKELIEAKEGANFIDQRGFKTLGFQIADLMKRVETEWFVYVHGDAFLTPYIFKIFEAYANDCDKLGILESDRIQYDYEKNKSFPDLYPAYYSKARAFSGVQLIRKDAIIDIVNRIEDDFVYRNEDLIFQNACENVGYEYKKCLALHIHTTTNINRERYWTPFGEKLSEKEARTLTYDMQVKGLVKYCTPTAITQRAWLDAFGQCHTKNGTNLFDFVETFVRKVNPIWEKAILDELMNLYPR